MPENQVQTVGQVSSLAEVEAARIDQQVSTAKRYPRDVRESVGKAISLATYNSKTAQSCIYLRPVGKKDGKQTFAEGPSIRLAEVLKSSWGNLRLGTQVVGERDGNIHVQAVCHDLENNVFETSEVAKSITYSDGGRYKDTMIQVIIGAASKIALRNVIFSVIPKAYAEQIMDACKEKLVGNEEERTDLRNAVIASFNEMGVTETALFSAVDRKNYPENSNDEVVFLVGLHNAIKDGICTVEDVFGKQSSKPEVKPTTPKQTGSKKKTEEAKKEAKDDIPAFSETLRATALQAGIKDEDKLCKILIENFEIETPEDVPAEMMGKVIDHFIALIQ